MELITAAAVVVVVAMVVVVVEVVVLNMSSNVGLENMLERKY